MYLMLQVRGLAQLILHPSRNALIGGCAATHDGVSFALLSPGPPIVSDEELSCLALISPANTSQYSGSRVRALIQILQHQMDQQELVKEFMVRACVPMCVCVHYVGRLPNSVNFFQPDRGT